jgi:hypothetical protein
LQKTPINPATDHAHIRIPKISSDLTARAAKQKKGATSERQPSIGWPRDSNDNSLAKAGPAPREIPSLFLSFHQFPGGSFFGSAPTTSPIRRSPSLPFVRAASPQGGEILSIHIDLPIGSLAR